MNVLVDPIGHSGVAACDTAHPARSLKPSVRLRRLRIERISKRDLHGRVAPVQYTFDHGVAPVEAADRETWIVVIKRHSTAAGREHHGAGWSHCWCIHL